MKRQYNNKIFINTSTAKKRDIVNKKHLKIYSSFYFSSLSLSLSLSEE